MKSLGINSTRSLTRAALLTLAFAIGASLPVAPTGAAASDAGLTTSLDIASPLLSRLARGPVPAAEAFRQITIMSGDDGSQFTFQQMWILVAAVVREGRVIAVQESRPFPSQPGIPVFDVPLFPDGWERNGYLPGRSSLPEGQFSPGDQFLPGDQRIPGDRLIGAKGLLCNGCSASNLERAAGVALKGRDTLVMGVVPADPDERASAQMRPLFIVAGSDAGPLKWM